MTATRGFFPRVAGWLALLILTLLTGQIRAERRQGAADVNERRRALTDVFKDPARADLDVVRRTLRSALADPDESMRRNAVDLIGSFRAREIFMPGAPSSADWQRFVPLAIEFRPALLAALADPSAQVRAKAVYALAATDVEVAPRPGGPPQVKIPPALAERLQQQVADDDSGSVRSWIVNFFGLSGMDHDPRTVAIAHSVLLAALSDSDAAVVQFAGMAMTTWQIPEALPLLIKQLGHASHVVRLGVAVGLSAYGASARQYLPQLEAAVKQEPEGPTKKTLEAAVTRIRDGR